MISNLRHTETDPATGKNLYIIEAHIHEKDEYGHFLGMGPLNTDFSRRRWGVDFSKGKARVTSRLLAQMFSEQLGYVVILHKDEQPWYEAVEGESDSVLVLEPETDGYDISRDESWENK